MLYPPDEERWAGRELRPYAAGDWAPGDAYGEAAAALADAGLEVHTWVVLAHNSRLGAEHPDTSVRQRLRRPLPLGALHRPARGPRATWWTWRPRRRRGPGARGTELESCGWYGLAHLHAHDKIAGVRPRRRGAVPDVAVLLPRLPGRVRRAGRGPGRAGRGRAARPGAGLGGRRPPGRTGPGREAARRRTRRRHPGVARTRSPVRSRRRRSPRCGRRRRDGLPGAAARRPRRRTAAGANAGVDPAHILSVADGVVVPCTGGPRLLDAFAEQRVDGACWPPTSPWSAGWAAAPARWRRTPRRRRRLGATELRLYHAGLASDADLALVSDAVSSRADEGRACSPTLPLRPRGRAGTPASRGSALERLARARLPSELRRAPGSGRGRVVSEAPPLTRTRHPP